MVIESPPSSSVATIVSGTPIGEVIGPVHDVQVDSRKCAKGSLFVAIRGERTDGHFYLEDAFRRGSSLSFITRSFYESNRAAVSQTVAKYDASALVVEDTVVALQELARHRMQALQGVSRIAITGSNGKTTTKDLLGAMLNRWRPTAISPGNLNSDIGLPLACFGVESHHEFALFEMGMNRAGEIGELVSIVRPTVAAITNIGKAHIGILGSQEAIVEEKRGVFAHICDSGRGFVCDTEPFRLRLMRGVEECVDFFGCDSTAGYGGVVESDLTGSVIEYDGDRIKLNFPGLYNVSNALCAISVATYLGVPTAVIKHAIEDARPGFGRGQVYSGRVTIVLDCYNANGDSVIQAIEMIDSVSSTGRKILVLGSMKELGSESESEHRGVARAAVASSASKLFFFGEEAAAAYDEAVRLGAADSEWYTDYDELSAALTSSVAPGDLVLLKGSRSLELERFVQAIDPEVKVEE